MSDSQSNNNQAAASRDESQDASSSYSRGESSPFIKNSANQLNSNEFGLTQIAEVDETGPFDSREQCQIAMLVGAKLLEQKDPETKYFLLCRKI